MLFLHATYSDSKQKPLANHDNMASQRDGDHGQALAKDHSDRPKLATPELEEDQLPKGNTTLSQPGEAAEGGQAEAENHQNQNKLLIASLIKLQETKDLERIEAARTAWHHLNLSSHLALQHRQLLIVYDIPMDYVNINNLSPDQLNKLPKLLGNEIARTKARTAFYVAQKRYFEISAELDQIEELMLKPLRDEGMRLESLAAHYRVDSRERNRRQVLETWLECLLEAS